MAKISIMSAEIDAHITKKYEIKKRLGKGVGSSLESLYYSALLALSRKANFGCVSLI